MPLRDFEHVRERIELRVEVRHLIQAGVGVLGALVLAFLLGYWTGAKQSPDTARRPQVSVSSTEPAPAPQVPADLASVEAPILPKAVAESRVAQIPVRPPEPPQAPAAPESLAPARVAPAFPTPTPRAPLAPDESPDPTKAAADADEEDPEVSGRRDPKASVTKGFHLQIRAFRDAAEAKTLQQQLKSRGHPAVLTSVEVPGKGTFWRLRLGPYASLEETRAAQRRFEEAEGLPTMILVDP
ncbi:MAG: SPOR domain-containing protein [Myxococcota bacterium]